MAGMLIVAPLYSWAEIDPKNPTAALKDKAAVHLKDEL